MSKSKTIWSTIAGVISSILVLLGIAGCCGLPILAGFLAILGIGTSQLSFFAEYRWWFIGFAILSLLFGFYQVYFRKSGNCCGAQDQNNCCSDNPQETYRPKQQLFQKIFLWIGAAVVAIVLIISYSKREVSDECCPVAQPMQTKQAPPSCCPQ